MVKIKPFSGLYYYNKYSKANNISKFVKRALDFDCVDFCSNEKSELNVETLQNFNMPNDVNENLKNWLKSGVLTVSGGAAFYVCEMTYKIFDRTYEVRGFFAAMALPEDGGFSVEKLDCSNEEGTRLVLNLLQKVNFQTSAVFAMYDDDEDVEISDILKDMCGGQCFERAKSFNVSYKVWEVMDEFLIERLMQKFEQIEKVYLVGGSEVYDAALINEKKDGSVGYVLTFFMGRSNEALAALPFHRVVSASMFDLEFNLGKIPVNFDFIKCSDLKLMRNKMFGLRCEGKRVFGVYAEDSFGVLVLLDDSSFDDDVRWQLDSFVTDEFILKKWFGLSDDCCVQYTNFASVAKDAVDRGDGCFALFLNSPRLNDLIKVSGCCEFVPKKAAYIFPRPVDGLIFYSVES